MHRCAIWLSSLAVFIATAVLPARAAAQVDSGALSVSVRTGTLTGEDRADAVQSVCLATFFGPSVVLDIGGESSFFLGGFYPFEDSLHSVGVFAPGFSLGGAANIRVLSPSCRDSEAGNQTPAPVATARPSRTGNWQMFFSLGIVGSIWSFVSLKTGDQLSLTLSVSVPVGLRFQTVWWDRFDDVSSRKTVTFAFGFLTGLGSGDFETSDGTTVTSAYLLTGGYFSFSVAI